MNGNSTLMSRFLTPRHRYFSKVISITSTALAALFFALQVQADSLAALRPPSVPLVTHDPYLSIWSPADRLTDADTVHWTGKTQCLASLVRIDAKVFRLLGKNPAGVPALPQTSVEVLPLRTIYSFAGEGVKVSLTFMTPALPDDLMIYSRPVTYITWTSQSTDGKEHEVAFSLTASAEITVNTANEKVICNRRDTADLVVLKTGSKDQLILGMKGDDLRINWGYLYIAAPKSEKIQNANFDKALESDGLENKPAALESASAVNANFSFQSIKVKTQPVSRWLMLAYDDEYSIQYFKKNLRPYWRRNGDDAAVLLKKSAADYATLTKRCEKFDAELMADLRKVGGEKYARLGALAYRQTMAGTKLVADENGQPLLFPKENTSNGCIGTADVIYPLAPFCLLFSPSLTKAMLVPLLDYASSPRWKFPFAPHDLGTYPLANGQVYGGGERTEDNQMPVEESANLIILTTALAEMEGNADFAGKYWPVLEKWAAYLKSKGFDPERQLCTDDFAGHLAHNVNLSAKAIVALGAFGRLCEIRGDRSQAKEFTELAHDYAARWVKEANDGDHFRLAFDQPGTWSQKYNLVWNRVLGLNLFPETAMRKEMDFYLKGMNRFGLALDNRKPWAELPWSFWTAALTGNRADFDKIFDPIYDYVNTTTNRVPFADFYWTQNATEAGMHARPVIGGIYILPLLDKIMWHKWIKKDSTKAAGWAPLPVPPSFTTLVPAADMQPAIWRYTTNQPATGWETAGFDDSAWSEGESGFGSAGTPNAVIGTLWMTTDIWLRRDFELPVPPTGEVAVWLHHDEDAEVYLNSVLALRISGWSADYDTYSLTAAGRNALRVGKNKIAVHCHQTTGGQYIDAGLVMTIPTKPGAARWTPEHAWNWFTNQALPLGFNYVPANSISYTEMWMGYAFDPKLIEHELALAQKTGFNCLRVVLPFVVWEAEPKAFKQRWETFLTICDKHGIKVMPCFFDDCVFGPISDPEFGKQPEVVAGWYASGWTPSPGHQRVRDSKVRPALAHYVKDIMAAYRNDPRILCWDLYNESGNSGMGNASLSLLKDAFSWAREINPVQPITSGIFGGGSPRITTFLRDNSDIISFHNYQPAAELRHEIIDLKQLGRPLICSEWLNRPDNSTVATCLPVFLEEQVGALNWGLVNGKTQTDLPWGHKPDDPEPKIWQHDLFHSDHTPYDTHELELFRQATRQAMQSHSQ